MTLRLAEAPDNEAVVMPATVKTDQDRQKFWQERNERVRAFWLSEQGKALEWKQRSYTLDFETNGAFRVDSVPAGTYDLYIRPTDPTDENGNYRDLGSLSKQVVIPEGPNGEVFDIGEMEFRLRRALRIGQAAPSFENKTLDGKAIKLQDLRGKFVLLHFTAQWANSQQEMDLQTLKSLKESYVKEGRLEIISLSIDGTLLEAQSMVTNNAMTWPVCYLGNWSVTQVPAAFGVEGVPHSILIGPEGNIVAKNLTGAFMKTAVRNALEAKKTASARPAL
jgi:hypothetical protein